MSDARGEGDNHCQPGMRSGISQGNQAGDEIGVTSMARGRRGETRNSGGVFLDNAYQLGQ